MARTGRFVPTQVKSGRGTKTVRVWTLDKVPTRAERMAEKMAAMRAAAHTTAIQNRIDPTATTTIGFKPKTKTWSGPTNTPNVVPTRLMRADETAAQARLRIDKETINAMQRRIDKAKLEADLAIRDIQRIARILPAKIMPRSETMLPKNRDGSSKDKAIIL